MQNMKILLTGAFNYNEQQLDRLKLLGFEIIYIQDERLPIQFDVSDIEAVVCNGLFLYNDIEKFKKLRLIQLTSAGLDRMPIDVIKKQGITLFNAKGVYSVPMAEWVLLKILEINKKSKKFYEAQYIHCWEKQRELFELTSNTAVIIGFGDVGSEIAKRLRAFGVYVIGVGRREVTSSLLDEYYTVDNIDKAISRSDIIILTLPSNKETMNLFSKELISKAREDSILINVSRGSVLEEKELSKALRKGKFRGVALDVFENEPLSKESELWDFDNVIITPHNSYVSDKTNERLFKLIENNLREINT